MSEQSLNTSVIRYEIDKKINVTFNLGLDCDGEALIAEVFVIGSAKVGTVNIIPTEEEPMPVGATYGGLKGTEVTIEMDFTSIPIGSYSLVIRTEETGLINRGPIVILSQDGYSSEELDGLEGGSTTEGTTGESPYLILRDLGAGKRYLSDDGTYKYLDSEVVDTDHLFSEVGSYDTNDIVSQEVNTYILWFKAKNDGVTTIPITDGVIDTANWQELTADPYSLITEFNQNYIYFREHVIVSHDDSYYKLTPPTRPYSPSDTITNEISGGNWTRLLFNDPGQLVIASQAEALTGTDNTKAMSPLRVQEKINQALTGLLELVGEIDCSTNPNYPTSSKGDTYLVSVDGKIGGASGVNVSVGDYIICKNDNAGGNQATVGSDWFVIEKNLEQSTETVLGILKLATQSLTDTGTDDSTAITPKKLANAGTVVLNENNTGSHTQIKTKVLNLGVWNMDSTDSITVNHGISSAWYIREVSVMIRSDVGNNTYPLDHMDASGSSGGIGQITDTNITLYRVISGFFDQTLFVSAVIFRGWITITYEE